MIYLNRKEFSSEGIFGELIDENGKLLAVTLEHAFLQLDGTYLPKIAAGVYTCLLGHSHHLDHMPPGAVFTAYEFLNLPNFMGKPVNGCLFHIGNKNADSDGCVLLGAVVRNEWIYSSGEAFAAFMLSQNGLANIQITVTNCKL